MKTDHPHHTHTDVAANSAPLTVPDGQHEHDANHTNIIARLKRAEGHLRSIIAMLEQGRDCVSIAQQLQAVESAIGNAKKVMVHDHIDHCLEHAIRSGTQSMDDTLREFKALTKYL